MLWLPLTIFSAFTLATADALTKKALPGSDVFRVAWLRNLFIVPFLLPALFFVPVPRLDATFFLAVGLALPLEVIATVLYIKAIEVSPLSLTMPFLALTPFYLLVTSAAILGETPGAAGLAGVSLLGSGAYLLNLHSLREGGLFAPFKAVYRDKGSLMMMAVAAIFALTSDLGKLAIIHSSPIFFGAFYVILFAVVFTPVALIFSKGPVPLRKGEIVRYLPIGAGLAASAVAHWVAISETQVSYMIAVKRTSLLFSIGYGFFMFREKNIGERLIGGVVMLAGLFVMAVF